LTLCGGAESGFGKPSLMHWRINVDFPTPDAPTIETTGSNLVSFYAIIFLKILLDKIRNLCGIIDQRKTFGTCNHLV
jgi:hypothetical protein